jgi:hypothetical protein
MYWVPVFYMVLGLLILMGGIHFEGHWQGQTLKILTFLGTNDFACIRIITVRHSPYEQQAQL